MCLARFVLLLVWTIPGALFSSWSIARDDILVLCFSRRCFSPLSFDDVNRETFVSEDKIARKSSRWRVLSCEMLLNAGFIVADGRCHCKPVDTGVRGLGDVCQTYSERAQRVFTAAFRALGAEAAQKAPYLGDVHYLRRITLSRPNTRVRSSRWSLMRGRN